MRERVCVNEIVIFDPYSNLITKHLPHHIRDSVDLVPRKYYAGFLLGNHYFCHGGQDSKGHV